MRGSQIRQLLENSDYAIASRLPDGDVLLSDRGQLSLWTPNDAYAGYVVVIDGIGYEFCRSAVEETIR